MVIVFAGAGVIAGVGVSEVGICTVSGGVVSSFTGAGTGAGVGVTSCIGAGESGFGAGRGTGIESGVGTGKSGFGAGNGAISSGFITGAFTESAVES